MGLRVSKIEKSYFCDFFVAFSSFSLLLDTVPKTRFLT